MQKCLQSVVREFQWRVGENHASEDTWSFVGYLNDEDLEKYADSKVLLEPVEFTGGKLAVLLRTQELNEGDVGVHMSTHFQAMGTDRQVFRPAGNHVAAQFKSHPGTGTDWRAANSLQTRRLRPFQSAATGRARAFVISACSNLWNRCSPASRRTDRRPAT